MRFKDLKFKDKYPEQGAPTGTDIQARHDFPNGYGASVTRGPYSYGGHKGFYEVAVMKRGSLCYDTPITDDVIGYCTPRQVSRLLKKIEALPHDS